MTDGAGALRILILEDAPLDAEIVCVKLRSAGIDFAVEVVDNREDFIAALERYDPQLIISDYSLPGFDGMEALDIVRRRSPSLPFLLVSGYIGEELAAEALKLGATDFLLKDRLGRLAAAVERAMHDVAELAERRRAEARVEELRSELLQVERLNAMAEIATSLAHELNQPLSAASNYAHGALALLEDVGSADDDPRVAGAIAKCRTQIQRASEIVRRVRAFVSRKPASRTTEELGPLLEDAGALAMIGSSALAVELEYRIEPGIGPVLVDKVQIQQVVLNLLRNAREAMANSPERRLVIGAAAIGAGLIEISVCDTGPGIAPDIAQRLFQPFNSSKADGMGVGLSICKSIVEAHGGRIWAQPGPTSGADFRFTVQTGAAQA